MKKTLFFPILLAGFVLSSCGDTPKEHQPDRLTLSGTYQTEFTIGDDFNYDGLQVNLVYDDGVSVPVSDFRVIQPNMYVTGSQEVTVQYITVSTTYTITVSPSPTVESISLSGDYQTVFTFGEEFNYDGLIVTANYSNGTHKEVSGYQVSTPDMSILGSHDVTVTYENKSKTYEIKVVDIDTPFPLQEVVAFLSTRGVSSPVSYIPEYILSIDKVESFQTVEDDERPYFEVVTTISQTEYENIFKQLLLVGWEYFEDDIYLDPGRHIGVKCSEIDEKYVFEFYAYNDLVEIPPEEEEVIEKSDEFVLYEILGNVDNLTINSPHTPSGHEDFSFSFYKGSSSNNPKSSKAGSYHAIAIYKDNYFTIETASEKYLLTKIELTTKSGYNGTLTANLGSVNQTVEKFTWTGNNHSVTFTAGGQYRFDNVYIAYTIPEVKPIPEGIKTISQIKSIAETLVFTGKDGYLVNNDVTVELTVKAIDAIDSVTTSGGIDPNSRGKVLCVDETDYIIVSSGVSKSNPIDFYQRVKDYIKAGTTTYYIKGHLAKLNDVLEVNVEEYEYRSDLKINYDLDNYLTPGVTSSELLMEHCKTIKTNNDGYGVGKIVKMDALTYFNKYNDAGSYYFLDQDGKLVPIYSLLDKDRSSIQEGKVYDIIGLESMYKGRPSLRILEVNVNLEADPASFDFSEAVSRDTTKYFYSVNPDNSTYKEEFYNSVVTIYVMDVFVSEYAYDKYTFSDTYFAYNKTFTTGTSQISAAQHYSLGIFNEDLEYKQLFLDYDLANAKTSEEADSLKITLYFTLSFLDTVDNKEMWRVNVFEDLVFGLDYYQSESTSIDFTSMTPSHDESKQWYQSGNLKVTNASTEVNNYSYHVNYFKVVDGTSLTIEFDSEIIAFTLYHKTYSYIAGVGELAIASYRQFKDHTVFLLNEPSKTININDFAVGGNRNNAYLGIESLTVNY